MQAKHTPGPWVVNGPTIVAAPTEAAPTGYALAHVLNPYAGATGASDRVDANAALIATAPELLAALHDIVSASDANCGDSLANAINSARAALDRATGAGHA